MKMIGWAFDVHWRASIEISATARIEAARLRLANAMNAALEAIRHQH
jgi:hypothetical protein